MEGQIDQDVQREHRWAQEEVEAVAKGLCSWAVEVAEVVDHLDQEVYHAEMDLETAGVAEVDLANEGGVVTPTVQTVAQVVEVGEVSMTWIETDCVNLDDGMEVNET